MAETSDEAPRYQERWRWVGGNMKVSLLGESQNVRVLRNGDKTDWLEM